MSFDIRQHIDKLTPSKGANRYICPVCEGGNLTVDPRSGAYKCWSGECESKEIRAAIAPFDLKKKEVRPKSDRTWLYNDTEGNPQIRVRRIDNGNGDRKIWQEYVVNKLWVSGGKAPAEVKDQAKKAVTPYRYQEAIEAAQNGAKYLFWVEGEPCADSLWELGIPAITSIGGSKGYRNYGNYRELFGSDINLVICPDQDEPGLQYANEVAKDFPKSQWLYPFPDAGNWKKLQPGEGGLDIADWISQGVTKDEILVAIGKRRSDIKVTASKQAKSKLKKASGESQPPSEDPDAHHEVKTTSDDWIFTNFFGAGESEWAVIDSGFYRYKNGFWERVDDQTINRELAFQSRKLYVWKKKGDGYEKFYPFATDSKLKSALNFSRAGLHVEQSSSSANLRCFRNVTLDLIKRETLLHNRNHYLTTVIDADYIPNQECPKDFKQFIESSYGLEMLPLIQACTAMLLDPTAPWSKFIHLIGGSGSGKGTLLRFWQSLYGEQHTRSGACFSDIAKPEGRHQNLSGVAVYALPDIGGYQQGLKPFYELVDNGSLSGRALFAANGYQKRWNVRFLVASVSPLQIENSGDGWDRRVITIPTLGSCLKPDPYLEEKLRSPEVKAGVISWALSMDKQQRDSLLMNPSQVSDRIADMEFEASLAGDPIKSFVDYCLRPCDDTPEVKSTDLHSLFLAYAQAFGYQAIGEKKFAQHLKTVIPRHYQERRRLTQKDPEFVTGVKGVKPARWINLKAIPGLFRQEYGVFTCDKSIAEEGGLYQFAEYVPWKDRILDHEDRILLPSNGKVSDPIQTLMHQGIEEKGSEGSEGSDTFLRHTREKSYSASSAIAQTRLVIPNGESPLCDPPDLSDPQPENSHTNGHREGSDTAAKYAIPTGKVCDPFTPGDRVITPRGEGEVAYRYDHDGSYRVNSDTWSEVFAVEQLQRAEE